MNQSSEGLDQLVKKYTSSVFENENLFWVLFQNIIYDEDDQSNSFFDISTSPPMGNREITKFSLIYLNCVIEKATKPELYLIENGMINTQDKVDAQKLEEFQSEWLQNHEVREKVRVYEEKLNDTFDIFNYKFILGRIASCHKYSMGKPEDDSLYREMRNVFSVPYFSDLDSYYYDLGRSKFQRIKELYSDLKEDSYGSQFLLSTEELRQFYSK